DIFFYDRAAQVIGKERGNGPVFVFVYLAANHFPWNYHYRPDLFPDWKNPGNPYEVDEYLRRQEMSARDYVAFKERLARGFPHQRFVAVALGGPPPPLGKEPAGAGARTRRGGAAHPRPRPTLLHHLLRHRGHQFRAGRSFIRARYARCALSAAGGAGRGR